MEYKAAGVWADILADMRYAMIMAGGAGTRLWPMSRLQLPKQLIKFIQRPGETKPVSLLELAASRLEGLIDPQRRYICTSESYRELIKSGVAGFTGKKADERILGEPMGRDTVNAVGLAAAVLAKEDSEAIFAVLTADHIIEPDDVFRARMDLGFRLVEDDDRRLVTFSITPTYPATGFGYVERGMPIRGIKDDKDAEGKPLAFNVARFVEKPDLPRAQAYVQSGMFNWNSGMFVWKAKTILDCLERFKPDAYAGIMEIQKAWGTKKQQATLEKIYPTLPKISVDYALMEPVAAEIKKGSSEFAICTVQMGVRWLDVGSWPSYAETVPPDADQNRFAGEGRTLAHKCKGNLSVNAVPGHTVALLGVDDLVVVHTADATLIMSKAKAEELKTLHAMVGDGLK